MSKKQPVKPAKQIREYYDSISCEEYIQAKYDVKIGVFGMSFMMWVWDRKGCTANGAFATLPEIESLKESDFVSPGKFQEKQKKEFEHIKHLIGLFNQEFGKNVEYWIWW